MSVIVKHQALEKRWLIPNQIDSPKTLVLGSFNPSNGNQNLVDYYYGRRSNHFWREIATIIGENEEYFFDPTESLDRKVKIMQKRFCCLDIIDSIEFTSVDEDLVIDYLNTEIFKKFSDQKIWTTRTNHGSIESISLRRTYNQLIVQTLEHSDSIMKVIHTMGNNRINMNGANPREHNLGEEGFGGFISKIIEICTRKNIEFVFDSLSPSAYAIKKGRKNRENLRLWLKHSLWL